MKINSISTLSQLSKSKTVCHLEFDPLKSDRYKNSDLKNNKKAHFSQNKSNLNKEKSKNEIFQKIIPLPNRNYINTEVFPQETTNLQEIKNLDQWVDHYQTLKDGPIELQPSLEMKKNKIKNKLKEINIHRKTPSLETTFPEVRQKIINSIFCEEDDEKKKNLNENENDEEQHFRRNILRNNYKSMEMKKHEINETLLNDLLYSKIQKKISNTKDLTLNLEIMNNPVINDTIANFKSLQNLFKMRSPINYENLLKKMEVHQNISKMFDFSKELEKINEAKKDMNNLEPILLAKFRELHEEIDSKKLIEKKLRISNTNNQKKLITEKNYLEQLQAKLQITIDNFLISSKKPKSGVILQDKSKYGFPNDSKKDEIEDFMKFNKLQEDRKKALEHEYLEIKRIKDQIHLNKESLARLEEEIAALRKRKTHIALKLKDLYLRKLKEGSSESLIWLIKAFWNLDEEISKDIFPTYLDHENIQFLFEMAVLEKKIEDIKKMDNPLRKESLKIANSELTSIQNSRFLNDKKGMIQRLKNISKTTKASASTKTNLLTLMKKRTMVKDDDSDNEIEEVSNQDELYEIVVQNKKIENEIKNLVDQLNTLIKNETDRVFTYFSEVVLDEKNMQKFKNILKALFGFKESEKKLETFFKLYENKNVIIKKNTKSKDLETGKKRNFHSRSRTITDIESPLQNRLRKELILNGENMKVNYNYNVSYNYYPHLQNSSLESTFYKRNLI